MTRSIDNRWGTRSPSGVRAVLNTACGLLAPATVRNVSQSGAFIEIPASIPLLSRVSVKAVSSGNEWLDSYVVRAEEGGVALEWLEPGMGPLTTFLAQDVAQPERLPMQPQTDAVAAARLSKRS